METVYIVIVAVLFVLAASDLVVGVSNDAVNFLNSAIGSKVAPFKIIMIIASLGIIVGATFSSGMMEVARKGIFHPQYFYFSEIMYIFLAVMITDVILLDTFNTYGMPTSTTVSIVFELLGAAVGIAIIKGYTDSGAMEVGDYINSGKALAIISGILLSVVISFTVGAIVQFITRIVFSFNYKKTIRRYGAIWGGIAITAITYFILIKGAKGASFMSSDLKTSIIENTMTIILISFVAWTIILQLFSWFTKLNILKLIVLVGTFALAMAFAGNDLVNFIGVPLAGYESFNSFIANPGADPNGFLMADLTGKVKTPTLFLLIAGLIMVVTLWFSKKAKSVTKTELNLARQDAGFERFGSSGFARTIVRASNNVSKGINAFLPESVLTSIEKRFDQSKNETIIEDGEEAPSFDLVRASVNLVVASILISFATSMKLPLSTTYVTFMVAMGTSLSDKAWDRESAVYRITGVFSVIGGWFLTAFSAFTIAFIVAFILYYGGIVAVFGLLAIAIFLVYRTHGIHKKVSEKSDTDDQDVNEISETNIADKSSETIIKNLRIVAFEYQRTIEGLEKEDLKILKKSGKEISKVTIKTKYLKDNINVIVDKLKEDSENTAYYFVEVLDYMREMLHSISYVNGPAFDHVNNNHKPLIIEQVKELKSLNGMLFNLIDEITGAIEQGNYNELDNIILHQQELIKFVESIIKSQIKRVKKEAVGTRNSYLFLNIVNESKNLALQGVNLFKSQRDFYDFKNGQ
jgi:phosphate/sulfate permease